MDWLKKLANLGREIVEAPIELGQRAVQEVRRAGSMPVLPPGAGGALGGLNLGGAGRAQYAPERGPEIYPNETPWLPHGISGPLPQLPSLQVQSLGGMQPQGPSYEDEMTAGRYLQQPAPFNAQNGPNGMFLQGNRRRY